MHGGRHRVGLIPVQEIKWNRLFADQIVANDEGPDEIVRAYMLNEVAMSCASR